MKKTCISVIMPIYNGEKWLNDCMESILNQDFCDFELIIIDDGSTDNTYSAAVMYAQSDNRVRVYKTENMGAAQARNFGVERAQGEYIYFCDADDKIEPDTLSLAYKAITDNDADLAVFGYFMEIVDKFGNIKCSQEYTLGRNETFEFGPQSKNVILELWDKSVMYNLVNRLFKKDIIDKNNIKFLDIVLGEDMNFCSEYITFCRRVTVISNCLYHYIREREGSVTTSYRDDWFELRVGEHRRLTDYFKRNNLYDDDTEEFLNRRFLERVLGCIENEMSRYNTDKYCIKRQSIKEIVNHKDVCRALDNVKPTSRKSRIMIWVVKTKIVWLNCLMGSSVSFVRNNMIELFFKLKGNR